MNRDYCTLFDRNYLAKGLSLHASLMRHSSEPFTLHILAMDEVTHAILSEMNLPSVKLIALSAFEEVLDLKSVRENRSHVEWCWTAASQLMRFLILWKDNPEITYLDSDLMFFSDPKVIFDEIGDRSIGITPHRFSEKEEKRLGGNGRFNVGVVYARNNKVGRDCISRWAAQTRERCSALIGCGDQCWLDEWPDLYRAQCCIIENLGVNLGPWSLDHIQISQVRGITYAGMFPLVAYHAHEFSNHKCLTGYPLKQVHLDLIYCPYITAWADANEKIASVESKITDRKNTLEAEWERA